MLGTASLWLGLMCLWRLWHVALHVGTVSSGTYLHTPHPTRILEDMAAPPTGRVGSGAHSGGPAIREAHTCWVLPQEWKECRRREPAEEDLETHSMDLRFPTSFGGGTPKCEEAHRPRIPTCDSDLGFLHVTLRHRALP